MNAKVFQDVQKSDLVRMVHGMLSGSLRTQGRKGAPLSPRSVRLTLTILSQAFRSAVEEGRLQRNVVALVKRPADPGSPRTVWESEHITAFLQTSDPDRLGGAWRCVAAQPVRPAPR